MIIFLTWLFQHVLAVIVFIIVFLLVLAYERAKYRNSQAHANRVAEAQLRELRKLNRNQK